MIETPRSRRADIVVAVTACLAGLILCAAAIHVAFHGAGDAASYRVPGFGFSSISVSPIGSEFAYRFVPLDAGGLNWSDFTLNVTLGLPIYDPSAVSVAIVNFTILDAAGDRLAYSVGPGESAWSWTPRGSLHPQITPDTALVLVSPVQFSGTTTAYLNEYTHAVRAPSSVPIIPH